MIFITTAQPWRVILLPRNRCVNSALIKKRDLCVLINICRQQAVVWTEPTPPRRSEEPTSGWRGTSWRPPTPVLSPPRQPVVRQLATNRLTGRRRGQEGRSTFPRSVSLDAPQPQPDANAKHSATPRQTPGPVTLMRTDFFVTPPRECCPVKTLGHS